MHEVSVKQIPLLLCFLPALCFSQKMGSTTLQVKAFREFPMSDSRIDNYIKQFPQAVSLTPRERSWFYWVNYSRAYPLIFWDSVVSPLLVTFPNLRNSYSASLRKALVQNVALPLLKPNMQLREVAQGLAGELSAKRSLPSHTSPSGATFEERMKKIGIKACAGENIGFGADNPVLMLVLLYIDEGVPELGHRKALLNPSFLEMGLGISAYPDDKIMVVQDFACDQDK